MAGTDARAEAERPHLRLATPNDIEDLVPTETGYHVNIAWERRYTYLVFAVDLVAIVVSSAVALGIRFANERRFDSARYALLSGGLIVAYMASMAVSRAYESRFLGVGSEEFKRVFNAAIRLTAVIGTGAYALQSDVGRRFLVVALPLATGLDLAGRYSARKFLVRLRHRGRCLHRVVVVGSAAGVADLVRSVARARYAGMQVVGCCINQRGPAPIPTVEDAPVLGDLTDIPAVVRNVQATTVAVTSRGEFTPAALRRLSWQLEGTGVDILVAPALTDIAGPRIHIRPVAGLPLLHVEEPELSGGRRVLKAGFDRTVALVAVVLLLPMLVLLGALIRFSSPGPMLFRQVRCGRGGRPFRIYKYRTMHTNAEAMLDALREQNEHGEGVLFKIKADPRVTRVGRFLRRYSLDELPQLLNVLKGEMSLVGPRPPLPSEVERYESDVRRRLLVKPGLTGLWQVSGRADLTWEESVRLDLEYVENWSLVLDFMILWKTIFAVVRGSGAY